MDINRNVNLNRTVTNRDFENNAERNVNINVNRTSANFNKEYIFDNNVEKNVNVNINKTNKINREFNFENN